MGKGGKFVFGLGAGGEKVSSLGIKDLDFIESDVVMVSKTLLQMELESETRQTGIVSLMRKERRGKRDRKSDSLQAYFHVRVAALFEENAEISRDFLPICKQFYSFGLLEGLFSLRVHRLEENRAQITGFLELDGDDILVGPAKREENGVAQL